MSATLTPVQAAVLRACYLHSSATFQPVTADCWWRASEPFRGGKVAFRNHLRSLWGLGYLYKIKGSGAAYGLTGPGVEVAR